MAEPAKVGFKWRWLTRTEASPCLLGLCDSFDAYLWAKAGMLWITALRSRADTEDKKAFVARMITRYRKNMKRAADCVTTCRPVIEALIADCKLAKEAAEQWGKPITIAEVPFEWPRNPIGPDPRPQDLEWLKVDFEDWPTLMARIWDTVKDQLNKLGSQAKIAVWRFVVPAAVGAGLLAFVIGRSSRRGR